MRLNVFLQRAGVGSRREAERLVEQGRIQVNGALALATTPVEEGDKVLLDGKPVSPAQAALPRLFLLHKPLDVLVTNRDHQNRPTVFELPALNVAGLPRLMSVGRLDVNSEGLLVLSTDGPLAQAMMSPDTVSSLSDSTRLARPKSVTCGWPAVSSRMFPGLRSRWRMPRW